MSIENMKKVKARIGFKWRKYTSTLMIQFSQWEVFDRNLHASLFSALNFGNAVLAKFVH